MRIFWNLFFFCLSLCLALAAGEGLTRVWVKHRGDALHRARRVITADPAYSWRQRAHLDTEFEGAPLITDATGFRQLSAEPRRAVDVVTIGPSSAFGWGVRAEDTYTEVAARDTGLIGFNAGQIGYSLTQGRRLYQELRNDSRIKDAKIVIISYGINDLDRFRFFGSQHASTEDDEAYFARDFQSDIRWERFATGSSFFELLVRSKNELNYATNCGVTSPPSLRLSPSKFGASLQKLIAEIRADNRTPILVNTPYRRHPTDVDDTSDIAYRNSARAHEQGHCREAREWVLKARSAEPERVSRDVVKLNSVISQVGAAETVPVVDAYRILGDDSALYFDPIHPSTEGHRRLAANLAIAFHETVDFKKTSAEPAR
ncbi:MAG: SGNH/GDSL hydrolase family protein [Bdellovibrionaceae bacterium]|nr:SGNH/GDSL hydrolase family protein [Pseudobdellovibrionaceae bacterium]